jgi:hypothetical protein
VFLVAGLIAGVGLGGVQRLRGNRGGVVLALLSGAFVLLFVGTLAEHRCTGASPNDVIVTVGRLGWATLFAASSGLSSRMLYRHPIIAFGMSIPISALVFVLSMPVVFILVAGDCLNPQ